jgi:hypothetical protein
MHPARAARVAILHQWNATQTEGWWRQAFDIYKVPYDYIDLETVGKTANLRAKYDVIVFGPGGGAGAVEGTPLWKNPTPWSQAAGMPNVGAWAQTSDTRIGMGLEGLIHLRDFINAGGVYIGSNSSAEFAITNNFGYGVSVNRAGTSTRVVGSLLRTKIVDDASPGAGAAAAGRRPARLRAAGAGAAAQAGRPDAARPTILTRRRGARPTRRPT